MAEWYALSAFSELGPMSRDALAELAASGEIDPDTLVREGQGAWQPARDVPGLCDAKPKRPVDPPVGKPKKSSGPKPRGAFSDAIDAAVAAEEAAEERPGMPHAPTPTEFTRPVTKAEVKQEARELASELAPSAPLWMLGVGAGLALLTWKAPSWSLSAFVHYAAVLAMLAGAALWLRIALGRELGWVKPLSTLAALGLLAGWIVVDRQVVEYAAQDGATHRDTIRRWSGDILYRYRTYRQPRLDYETWGPTDPAGEPHGHWHTRWTEPVENNSLAPDGTWFFHGKPVSAAEWQTRQSEGK